MLKPSLIERALFPGVMVAGVTLVLALMVDARLAPARLRDRALSRGLQTADLSIKEIRCTRCRAEMRTTMAAARGVAEVEANSQGMTVAYDPGQSSPERLVGVIVGLGYHAVLRPANE